MPGFVARHSSLLPPSDSKYSREGTVAHECAKQALLLGTCDRSLFPSKDMFNHVSGYIKIVEGWRSLPGAKLFVEKTLPLFYDPSKEEDGGTTDAGVVTSDNRVFIGDLKYGAGVSVQAERNSQITIYAISFILFLIELGYDLNDDTEVVLMIYQPRVLGEKAVRLWAPKLSELMAYGEEIGAVADLINADPHSPQLVFAPDDKTCQFCHAVSICKARTGQLLGVTPKSAQLELLGPPVVKPGFPAPETLTIEQLARVVKVAPEMKKWLNKAETYAAQMLHSGKKFPGFKLVEGRSNRRWSDELSAVVELQNLLGLTMEDLMSEPKLISPSQAEELLKEQDLLDAEVRAALSAFIVKPPGKPVLVPVDDPRAEYEADPSSDFEAFTPDNPDGMNLPNRWLE